MASDKIIHGRIKIEDLNQAWFFKGEKGTYIDFTMFYNNTQDENGQNGMIVQTVPKPIYEKEKAANVPKNQMTRGNILGNMVDFATRKADPESTPGYTGQTAQPATPFGQQAGPNYFGQQPAAQQQSQQPIQQTQQQTGFQPIVTNDPTGNLPF